MISLSSDIGISFVSASICIYSVLIQDLTVLSFIPRVLILCVFRADRPPITSVCLPDCWQCSLVTPVPKVAKPCQLSDFRPISVTPILSRVLEKNDC